MKIAHISDIHWRGLSRHAEYTKAFEILFKKIKDNVPDIIFLGGDLFHTKTSGISPEVIDRLAWMLRGFADLAPTHITLGNHDGNLANEDRQDVITPIVNAIDSDNLFLYKESGNYHIGDIQGKEVNLCVYSCFDKGGWDRVTKLPDAINIAAFHGSVGGSKMDNGWAMPDDKAEVQLSMFDGYDFVLLGDIHKRQSLAERPNKGGKMKPHVAYPGSTIQQNFGEDMTKGFLAWDIRAQDDWNVEFVEVENLQPFITFPWKGTVEATLKALEGRYDLGPGFRYRISSEVSLMDLEIRQLQHELSARGAEVVVFDPKNTISYDVIDTGGVKVQKSGLRNNPDAIFGLYEQFLSGNTKKFALTPAQVVDGKALVRQYLDKFNALELETTRDVQWSLKSFEFDNLYRYGSGNKLNFQNLNGVVGVFGKNKLGKSSLVGALMYVLFNASDREGVIKNGQIMNQTKKECSARAVVTVDGVDYVIERKSSRVEPAKKSKTASDPDKTETSLVFKRINSDGSEEFLNGITRDETDKNIRKLLGNSQDFLMTSVAAQSKMERFIDEGATGRKVILNRFLDLDLFDKLHEFAKDDAKALNIRTASYGMGWDENLKTLEESIRSSEEALEMIEGQIPQLQTEGDTLRLLVAQNKAANVGSMLSKARQEIQVLQGQLERAQAARDEQTKKLAASTLKLQELVQAQTQVNPKELQAGLDRINEITTHLHGIRLKAEQQKNILGNQEKSIKKLSLVPCGDEYPSCMYIKDSHEDAKKIVDQRELVKNFTITLEGLTADLQEYKDKQFKELMEQYTERARTIKSLEGDLTNIQEKIKLLGTTVSNSEEQLQKVKVREAELAAQMKKLDPEALEAQKKELESIAWRLQALERNKAKALLDLGTYRAKVEQIEKDRTESEILLGQLKVLESVQAAFHKNGIPALVLKSQLPAINSELSKLLSGLVDFEITFETESGSNVMDIWIQDKHSRRILELGSGMEKMIASIAIRVALINLSSLPKSDILVIDEGFNALDEENVGKCLELLQTLKSHFRSVLVISHMQRVKEAADRIVEVVSTGLDSKIEV